MSGLEKTLEQSNVVSQDKIKFIATLVNTLRKLQTNENIDDSYINFSMDKLELYIFNYKEDYETENFITETLAEWETQESYFPEVFINQSDEKMNILPRKAFKIC